MRIARALAAILVLAAAPAAAQDASAVSLLVVEAGTGDAVAGARVSLGGAGGTTDAAGRIRVAAAPGTHPLRVAHPSYATASVDVTAPADGTVRIALTPRPLLLDAVVATASRRMETLGEAPVATEVIGRDRIERTGASDLASVLTTQPGVELQGGHPAGAGVYLQGLGSERVLVLVDGEPVTGRIAGALDLSRLPAAAIERVEVVKGPQSTLYGSEAMGGVVNVVTRGADPRARGVEASVTTGTQGRRDATLLARGGFGAVGWTAQAGRRDVALLPGNDGGADAGAERWDGQAKAAWVPSPALRMEAGAWAVDERQTWRTGQLHHFADNSQWAARLSAAWRRGVHRLAPALYLTGFDHLLRRSSTDAPVAGTGDREAQRLAEAELLWSAELGAVTMDGGVEARREWIDSDRVDGGTRDGLTTDAFGQATWRAGALTVVPGVRLSHADAWGTHATPRVALLWRPAASLALRASAGEGYRAPSFKELYLEFLNDAAGYAVRGNPDLRPERSRSASVGAEWAGERAYVRSSAFHTTFRGFIETVLAEGAAGGTTLYTYGNVDRGTTSGVELQGGAAAGALRADVGYTWLRARDEETGRALSGRPAHAGRLTLAWSAPGGVRASATASYTGEAPVETADGGQVDRGAWTRLDVRLAHPLPRGFTLAAGADNLAGSGPAGWPGFTGRHLYLTLSWSAGGSAPARGTGDEQTFPREDDR